MSAERVKKEIIIASIVWLTIGLLALTKPWEIVRFINGYNEAWQLVMDKEYDEARDIFIFLNNEALVSNAYKRGSSFGAEFASACKNYYRGDVRAAFDGMDWLSEFYLNRRENRVELNKEQSAFVEEMIDTVNRDYHVHQYKYDAEYEKRMGRNKGYVEDINKTEKTDRNNSGSTYHSGYKTTSKKNNSTTEFDPDDHDIDQYYEDYKDDADFEDIDDAYDDFEDNPEYWDDY